MSLELAHFTAQRLHVMYYNSDLDDWCDGISLVLNNYIEEMSIKYYGLKIVRTGLYYTIESVHHFSYGVIYTCKSLSSGLKQNMFYGEFKVCQ